MYIKQRLKMFIIAVAGLLLTSVITIQGIYAYMTYTATAMENNFTIALDTMTTVVEKFPSTVPDMNESGLISYEKMVQVANTGYLDCFVRVKINFSEKDIRNKSSFSWDGQNYYSYNDYKDHLPANWAYNPEDDCFYYMNMVLAGDWPEFSNDLTYDKSIGEYFYKDKDDRVLEGDIITTPLFRHIKTQFANNHDMRTYDINVIEESCPFYLGTDYAEAWAVYDAEEWN